MIKHLTPKPLEQKYLDVLKERGDVCTKDVKLTTWPAYKECEIWKNEDYGCLSCKYYIQK